MDANLSTDDLWSKALKASYIGTAVTNLDQFFQLLQGHGASGKIKLVGQDIKQGDDIWYLQIFDWTRHGVTLRFYAITSHPLATELAARSISAPNIGLS